MRNQVEAGGNSKFESRLSLFICQLLLLNELGNITTRNANR